jgi:uncharacterized protein (TIGR02678 family)
MTPRVERPAPAEDVYAVAERRRAARALLRRPLLHENGPDDEDFRLVRRHREELSRLFAEGLGYRLVVEPRSVRLYKAGLGRDGSRPLRRKQDAAPFTPRAYALLCVTIAAVTRCKEQLLVDELVNQVRSAAADAGIDVDLDAIADRRALHSALMVLLRLGVLQERDGDLRRWAEDSRAQSLLNVERERLRLLVAAPLSRIDSPEALLDESALPSAAGGARVAVRRRLVESSVLSVTELPSDQAEWWAKNRNREREWFRERLGLELELRAEGAIAIDPDGELSDDDFPGAGSAKHFALLLVERLVGHARDGAADLDVTDRVWRLVPGDVVEAAVADLFATYRRALKKEHRDKPGLLGAEALAVLRDFGLVSVTDDGWLIHAAAARYAARATIAEPAETGEASLFEEGSCRDPIGGRRGGCARQPAPLPVAPRGRAQRLAVRPPGLRHRRRSAAAARRQRGGQVQDAGDAPSVRARRRQGATDRVRPPPHEPVVAHARERRVRRHQPRRVCVGGVRPRWRGRRARDGHLRRWHPRVAVSPHGRSVVLHGAPPGPLP